MKRTRGRGVERRGTGEKERRKGGGPEWMGEAQTGRFSRVDGGVEASGGGGGKPFPRRFRSLTDAFAKALRTFLARSTSSRGMLLLSYVFI